MKTRAVHAVLLASSLLFTSQAWAHGYRHGGPRGSVVVATHVGHGGGFRHVHGRGRVGVYFGLGVPLFWPYYHPYPYYAYPPYARETIIYDSPPAYTAPVEAPPAYWYFCREANGYYPYVSQCPGGWEKVPATPPSGSARPAESR